MLQDNLPMFDNSSAAQSVARHFEEQIISAGLDGDEILKHTGRVPAFGGPSSAHL